jgi:SAM-dependent methyltransferase
VHQAEFRDPRLVAVYEQESPWSDEDEYFCAAIAEYVPTAPMGTARRVLDVGCGTGRFATGLANRGYVVTGIDPARASLEFARARIGGDAVTWIEGTTRDLPDVKFEAAVMTKHVSQFFVSDEEWAAVLADVAQALVSGGVLTFDMRDARDREWDTWTADAVDVVVLPDGNRVEEWTEVIAETANTVSFRTHYSFSDGTDLESTATLRFRDPDELAASLAAAGLVIERIDGGWQRQPVGHGDGELLVVARLVGLSPG